MKDYRMLNIQKYHSDLQQCPSQSHPMGMLRKRHQIPFLCLVRAGITASPSGYNQTIKTTTYIFTQMQHKHHPHLSEDRVLCASANPQYEVIGSQSAAENPPHAQKRSAKLCIFFFFFALKKYDPHYHHSWWQTGKASEQGRSPVH